MSNHTKKDRDWGWHEGLISALAFGGFLIILGVVFGLTPGISGQTIDFFTDITAVSYPAINGNIILPAPADPSAHLGFYVAVLSFFVGIAVLQVVILALRLWYHSRLGRIAETVGNLVFWAGGAVAAYVFLLAGTLTGWFTFWAMLLIIVGISLIVRGLIIFAKRH
ncbi:MAG: hypothetical protein NWE93_08460 [Candidatus Bathyarchaeota archaeon]|nr:hypothetical protein [Candidatus Bathyarchaeota archaeon]